MLNVQGLTQSKMIEIEQIIMKNKHKIFCAIETHQTRDHIHFHECLKQISSMRKLGDKKGGGISLFFQEDIFENVEKIPTDSNDILAANICLGTYSFTLIAVYASTNDFNRNLKIYKEIQSIVSKMNETKNILVMGDLNGHVGFIGPQPINRNGKLILDLADTCNMNILNLDPDCTGEITWKQGSHESAIDFALCNSSMYKLFMAMQIDENQEIINLSDHNLISIQLKPTTHQQKESQGKNFSFVSRSEEAVLEFTKEVETRIRNNPDINIRHFNNILSESVELHLKKTVKRRKRKSVKEERPWMNKRIEKEISVQRCFRKKLRKDTNFDSPNRIQLKDEFAQQKLKVNKLVREASEKYERELTRKILNDKNRNKKIYQHIKTLKNQQHSPPKPVAIFDVNNKILEEDKIEAEIRDFWIPIYQQHRNEIPEKWNEVEKKKYHEEFAQNSTAIGKFNEGISIEGGIIRPLEKTIKIDKNISEHFECAMPVEIIPNKMSDPMITREEVVSQIKMMKAGKSPGPDSLKPEIYKYLVDSPEVVDSLTVSLNKIVCEGSVPAEWKRSKTILIPKTPKPKASDLRPIALIDVSYKILMGILKNKIAIHLYLTNQQNDQQTGATKNRRVTENIHIIQYMIQKSYILRKKLFILSIDFQKAFDSVNRYCLFKTLLELKIHPNIVNVIADIYSDDDTSLYFNNKVVTDINITSGIRQGCNLSALLFILITYKLIQKFQSLGIGYRDDNINLSSLFYMDDGVIFTDNIEDMRRVINGIGLNCFEYGLKLNKNKCRMMIVNDRNSEIKDIDGIQVNQTIKYLGVLIDNKKGCFNSQKNRIFENGLKFSNQTYSVLGKACDKMLVGKTFYKGLVLPGMLYAGETIPFNIGDIKKLQIFDNRAYRNILGVPSYTAVEFLRGEVGASSAWSRDAKNKIFFLKHALEETSNQLLKEIITQEIEEIKTEWSKVVRRYMNEIGLTLNQVQCLSKDLIMKKINNYDEKKWNEEMTHKKTLERYRMSKENIEEVKWFRNGYRYSIMMRARADALKLNWREINQGQDKICNLCTKEEETLHHFLLKCEKLHSIRHKFLVLQMPYEENEEELMKKVLLFKDTEGIEAEYFVQILLQLWMQRTKLLHELE